LDRRKKKEKIKILSDEEEYKVRLTVPVLSEGKKQLTVKE